jgi:hypothetical protein
MTIATYSELVSEMGDWLNRSDLTTKIPTFIRLFEARMNRRLRAPDMEQSFSFTTVAGTSTYSINSRVRELRELYLTTDDSASPPVDYTVSGETIVFDPVPTAAFPVTYSGYATLVGLDSGNATNWLLDDHPDAYLFGTLCMAAAYLKDDDRVAIWKQAWDEAMAEIIKEANEKRLPAGPLQMQPAVNE